MPFYALEHTDLCVMRFMNDVYSYTKNTLLYKDIATGNALYQQFNNHKVQSWLINKFTSADRVQHNSLKLLLT